MKAKLVNSYIHIAPFRGFKKDYQKHLEFKKWIEDNKWKYVDIDTEYIFDNQYNTVDGFRIFDAMIEKIVDDVRTDKNVFFVNFPNGKNEIKKVDFQDKMKNKRFYSCYSVNENYYRISRRSNIEFILAGANNEIWITNGIGYNRLNDCNLTSNEIKILNYCREKIIAL